MELFKDIKIKVRIRLASTKMFLFDVKKLDNGSIIDGPEFKDDKVELVYQNTVIAYGEVVSVDGKYGLLIKKVLHDAFKMGENRNKLTVEKTELYTYKDLE